MYLKRFLLKMSWLLAMQFSTRDACCTLSCGCTVKPLFYRLHEVETVGLWVWFPFMICLGWWAGTTGLPRIPLSQGCEHLSVMPLFRKCYVPKKNPKIIWRMRQIFIEFHLVFESGILYKKDIQIVFPERGEEVACDCGNLLAMTPGNYLCIWEKLNEIGTV